MVDTGGVALKVDFISDAYSQLRISGITVDANPEELEVALTRLEDTAAEWFSRNICAGYNFEDEPDPNSDSGVPRAFWQAFSTNLAIRLIPDFNKEVPQALIQAARQSLSNLSARSAADRLKQVEYSSRQPRGSGNTLRYNRWNRFYRTQDVPPDSCDTNQITIGDTDDYVAHFDSYLDGGEAIIGFTIEADSGLTVNSSSLASPDINYRVTGKSNATLGNHQRVKIVIGTDTGRVKTRYVDFDITSQDSVGTV